MPGHSAYSPVKTPISQSTRHCKINATMRKGHQTHTTNDKQQSTNFYSMARTCSTCGSLALNCFCTDVLRFFSWFAEIWVSTNPTHTARCPHNQSPATARNQVGTSHAVFYGYFFQRLTSAQACHWQCVPVAHHGGMLALDVRMLHMHSAATSSIP